MCRRCAGGVQEVCRRCVGGVQEVCRRCVWSVASGVMSSIELTCSPPHARVMRSMLRLRGGRGAGGCGWGGAGEWGGAARVCDGVWCAVCGVVWVRCVEGVGVVWAIGD